MFCFSNRQIVRAARAKKKVFQGWLYFSVSISKKIILSFSSLNDVYIHAGLRRGVLPVCLCCRTILARLLWNPLHPLVKMGKSKGWVPQNEVFCVLQLLTTWVLAKVKVLTPEIQERVQATEDFFRRCLSQRMLKNHLRDGLVLPLSTPKRYHVTWESSPIQFSTFVGIY